MLPDEDNDDEEEQSPVLGTDDDDDDDFRDELDAISRACTLTGLLPTDLQHKPDIKTPQYDLSSDSDSDSEDDLELLRGTYNRFTETQSLLTKPLTMLPPATFSDEDSDDEDDEIILRGIQERYSSYINGFSQKGTENHINNDMGTPCSAQPPEPELGHQPENQEFVYNDDDGGDDVIGEIPNSRFPNSAQMLMRALNKNRECQQFIRSKLVQITAKVEENRKLMERVKMLKDYQTACKRRIGLQLSQKKDPLKLLISAKKPVSDSGKKSSTALLNGPEENPHVARYKSVMDLYLPQSLNRTKWLEEENKCLEDGIKQQFQELLFVKASDKLRNNETTESIDSVFASIKQVEITPPMMRSFLPKVNWDSLSKMCLNRRSGEECEARWLSSEDKLINHSPWDNTEDKKLLSIVMERGVENWIDIAMSLGTNRTPSQCLIRYQRSLNKCMLKSEWTEEEDEQLRTAVEEHGESNWQAVASSIDGRTGTQCSNRWLKALNPARTRVGKWGSDEDKRLTVAVMLFGAKNWPKIAEFVPGRTQVQCRERWSNSLDPKVKMSRWSEEEDSRLIVAVEEFAQSCRSGFSSVKDKIRWAKVAEKIPGRTDNMCRRRAMVLFPNLKMFLHETRVAQQKYGIINFVDREEERPALGVADFVPLALMDSAFDPQSGGGRRRRRRKKKKPAMGDQSCSEEELLLADGGESGGEDAIPQKERVLRPREKKKTKKECSNASEPVQDMTKKKKDGSSNSSELTEGCNSSELIRDLMKKKKKAGCDSAELNRDLIKEKKKVGFDSAELNRDLIKEKKRKKNKEDCDSSELIRDFVKKKTKLGSKNVDPCKKRKRISGSKKLPAKEAPILPNGGSELRGNGGRPCKKKANEASCSSEEIRDVAQNRDVKTRSSFGRLIKRPRRVDEDITPSTGDDATKKKKGRKTKQCSTEDEDALFTKNDSALYKQWMKSLSLS